MIGRLLARLRPPLPAEPLRRDPPPDRFAACLAFVLEHEGGFVDHPSDPGGATNMGITLATLQHWRGRPTSAADVRALTRDEAAAIYRKRFWEPMRCAELPPGVDLMVFDFGVNAGPARAVRHLQQVIGAAVDGVIGPQTLALARAADGDVIGGLAELRMAHYRRLPHWTVFGTGWTRRTEAAVKVARTAEAGWNRARKPAG